MRWLESKTGISVDTSYFLRRLILREMRRPTLLIPAVFPNPEIYPLDNVNVVGLNGFNITLFGFWNTPENGSQEAMQEKHEAEAKAVLYDMAAQFSRAGALTDVQLHFGHSGTEEGEFQERIAAETNVDGVLIPKRLTRFSNILVPLRDDRKLDEIVDFICGFDRANIFVVELYHAAPNGTAIEAVKRMLTDAKQALLNRGFVENDLEITAKVTDNVEAAIVDRVHSHNIVIVGETGELEIEDRFLGPIHNYIANKTNTPIIVI